jgi:hypothetical protein
MATLDFWILFVAFLFSSGTGLIIINNLGQLVPAVGGRDGDVGTCQCILVDIQSTALIVTLLHAFLLAISDPFVCRLTI